MHRRQVDPFGCRLLRSEKLSNTRRTSPWLFKSIPSVDSGVKKGTRQFCRREPWSASAGTGRSRSPSRAMLPITTPAAAPKCWKPAGATFSVVAVVPRDNVNVLENGDKLQVVDASATIQRHACKACGTHMYGRIENTGHPFYGLDFIHPELFQEAGSGSSGVRRVRVVRAWSPAFNRARWTESAARLKELGLEPYDCLSPALMDAISSHVAEGPRPRRLEQGGLNRAPA